MAEVEDNGIRLGERRRRREQRNAVGTVGLRRKTRAVTWGRTAAGVKRRLKRRSQSDDSRDRKVGHFLRKAADDFDRNRRMKRQGVIFGTSRGKMAAYAVLGLLGTVAVTWWMRNNVIR